VTGSLSHSIDKNDKQAYNFDPSGGAYTAFDTALSNVYKKTYTNRSAGAGWLFSRKKFFLSAGLTYNIATLNGEQEFPRIFKVEKNFYSFQPNIMMSYNLAWDKRLNLSYRTFANAPSASQLQNVIDNSNPLQLTTGNPSLKQEYSHNIMLRLSGTDYDLGSSYFVMIGGTVKNNNIGSTTIFARRDTMLANGLLLNFGSQLSYPENYSGFYSLQSFITYGIPVDFVESTINLNLSGNYTNNPGKLNGLFNTARTSNYGAGLTVSSNISEDVDFTVSSTAGLNLIRNTADAKSDDDYYSQNSSVRFYWYAFELLTLSADFTHRYIEGLAQPSSYQLNFGVGMKMFENRKGELKLSVFDALNRNNNTSKTTTDSYTQEYSTNLTGRYYLLTFVYTLNAFM